ncbi:MAG TPA: hypothetical protein VFJ19_01315, partial [Nocardioidaceae bacterium]|nr:hypothetical protein [Nocardioidaceae bacterium]
MRRTLAALTTAVLTVAGLVGPACSADRDVHVRSARSAGDDAVRYVVAISVDGLNPDAIRRLGREGAPAFHRLVEEG